MTIGRVPIQRVPVFANPEGSFFVNAEGLDSEGSCFCQSGRVKFWQSGGVPNRRGPVFCQSGGVPEIRSDPEESKKFYFYEGNRTDPNT